MQPIQHPQTILLIHQAMIDDHMERHGRLARRVVDMPGPRPGNGIRAALGKALIALGTRIEPRPEPDNRPAHAGGLW